MSDGLGRVVVLGSLNLDLQIAVPHLPARGETVSARQSSTGPGGKGLNQAVAAARTGARVELVGAVGDDEAGRRLLEFAIAEGIGVDGVATLAGVPTGQAVVLVDEAGDNSIVVVEGANGQLGDHAEEVEGRLDALAIGSDDVLLAQAETSLVVTARAMAEARRRGARTVLNLAPFHPPGDGLLAATSVLVVNETEFDLLAAGPGAEPAPFPAGARPALARTVLAGGPDVVVVTLGPAGAIAVDAAGDRVVPGRAVEVVDTTGAGDGFVGALAGELATGHDLDHGLRWATAAASLVVQRPGAAAAMPTRTQVEGAISASGA